MDQFSSFTVSIWCTRTVFQVKGSAFALGNDDCTVGSTVVVWEYIDAHVMEMP